MSTIEKVSKTKKKPIITPPITKDKDKALQEVIGIWKDRKGTNDTKGFRKKLWRKTN